MYKLTPIKPYDDDKLVFDKMTNQYRLTVEFCKAEFEDSFQDDETLKKRIRKNSRVIYTFIKSRVNQRNLNVVFNILHRTEEGRNFIFELLSTQMESDVDSGYNDLTNNPAVNLANGNILPREELLRNMVSVATEQLFDTSASYFGFNLGYQAQFPGYIWLMARNL